MMTILEHELLQTINRDGVRWLAPASPAYAQAKQAAENLAAAGKLVKKGDRLEKVK